MTALTHFRMDLDKTYLATPLEDRLRMIRLPFESVHSKLTLPGMAALVRSLGEQSRLTVLSASPTFMARKLKEKLDLDGVPVQRLVLKDQWSLLKKGRLKEIADPFGYKLHALATLAKEVGSDDREVLLGDDWDQDPLIYSMYADLRTGLIPDSVVRRLFALHNVRSAVEDEIRKQMTDAADAAPVRRIFIRRERRRDASYFQSFGSRLRVFDDTFQLAILMFDDRLVSEKALVAVVDELRSRRWRDTAFAIAWRSLIAEQRLARFRDIVRVLRSVDVLPPESFWQRLRRRLPVIERVPDEVDWNAVVDMAVSPEA